MFGVSAFLLLDQALLNVLLQKSSNCFQLMFWKHGHFTRYHRPITHVQRHTWRVVWSLVMVLLPIFFWL